MSIVAQATHSIHIRIKNKCECPTYIITIDGIASAFDLKKLGRKLKRYLLCGGIIQDGQIKLVTRCDERKKIIEWLCEQGVCNKQNVRLHL